MSSASNEDNVDAQEIRAASRRAIEEILAAANRPLALAAELERRAWESGHTWKVASAG